MILVTGITGRIGSSIAKYLLEDGQEVGGLVRNPKQLESLPAGITGFVGDFDDPGSTEEAIKAADSLYLLAGMDKIEGLYDVAKKSGVKYVVQLSAAGAALGEAHDPVARFMVHAERTAAASGIAYTVLRPTAFMSNALRWADQALAGDHIRLPFDSVAELLIDPDDIGCVAAAILCAPEQHAGNIYQLLGPQMLRPSDCVRIVSDAIGRPLEFTALSDEEWRTDMSEKAPPEVVQAFIDIYAGRESFIEQIKDQGDDIERLTGAPPRTFEMWVRENKTAFIA